ncbi:MULTISPECIES: hypothetical protein [Lactiplantibacillus]|uniref:Uncharacterized protein n=1 Tax=Lactiplantibacillus paraplantarum TaxID=60520 RepID=A0A2I9D8U5_9LACO|nr:MULTISPECIES: hypothetical protein [Lactiplantibacillus]AVW10868.1 hypothetical protein DA077_10115 [Lactiplantibacillus paraplantarum]AYJ39275.1 hypothetical protein LP667_10905 [Lactiplantibacillus paraplantarum]ERL42892.1 hypothetical protein N644_3047 [Lactiplantibacillus paraplantarum]MCT4457420.1 hypothetical protein [Lactiplantibacillus paraplantarum]MCU4684331.1 hypothetical protein [Lactiplantibacillus paraplantarum]
MSFFSDLHFLPGTHTSSHTSYVSNQPLGTFYQFVLNVIAAVKG